MAQNYYDAFIAKLQEIFMMDHAELDFGIYRIMNQKRHDIDVFLKTKLLPQVQADLSGAANTEAEADRKRMAEILQQLGTDNIETQRGNTMPLIAQLVDEYDRLQAKLAGSSDMEELQAQVFSHLVTFFSRYYDGGDFISKRRYKENTYAIPYNGEEVRLHWANSDQYYIKTSEYFRDYTFVLPNSRRKVHFILRDATTEQNNNKAQNNMERRFAIWQQEGESDPVVEENANGDFCIYFSYELMPKATKQDGLLKEAFDTISPLVPEEFAELLTIKQPTKKEPNRTLLEKHLTDYTAKNSFDYFIHKDLGSFLRREMDFYIKNEVLHIDDLDPAFVTSQLTIVKAIKNVGEKIISMLAQLEDFQKRLWLKKKFVLQSDYCITLDRVPESLYSAIIENEAQRKEWVRLFAIDDIKGDGMFTHGYSEPLSIEFLKENPFLVLDTAFFDAGFKHKLMKSMENIDEQTNGLLINSENSQALRLLFNKYKKAIQTTYIDPPYNTVFSKILYKNNYEHSSWLSLMNNTIPFVSKLWTKDFSFGLAIDDYEFVNLARFLDNYFPEQERSIAIVNHHPQGSGGRLSRTHEYYILISEKDSPSYLGEPLEDYQEDRNFMRSGRGENNFRQYRWKSFYALLMDPKTRQIVDVEDAVPLDEEYPKGPTEEGLIRIYPINGNGEERVWRSSYETGRKRARNNELFVTPRGAVQQAINHEAKREVLMSNWVDSKFGAGTNGTTLLEHMGLGGEFDYPKSIYTLETGLWAQTFGRDNGIILDYFAGSGTTAHAVINMNRKFGGDRKFILVEMGNYFNTATRPRIMKAIYSSDWRDGKPVSRQGLSQCFKYIRLEQYEDTLNNLQLKIQQTTTSSDPFHESYMLGYWLDTEARDSLLNLKWFENPFAMTLKSTRDNELVDTPVDMVETFNYLIGLNVETESWYKDDNICVLTGRTHREGLKTLVIWRNCKEIDNKALNAFFDRMDFRTRDSEFDLIYVNGDNTLPNLRRNEEHWKVVLIEEEFQNRMFTEE